MTTWTCPDCSILLGFDPRGDLGQRRIRFHRETTCAGHTWVQWRLERRAEHARRRGHQAMRMHQVRRARDGRP